MFGRNPGQAPPSWHAQFEKTCDEDYGRDRYKCKNCSISFSATGARQHAELNCVGAAPPQLVDQSLPTSAQPRKKRRTISSAENSVTDSDRHDDHETGSQDEAGSGHTAAGAAAEATTGMRGNDTQLFETGDAEEFLDGNFDDEAVQLNEGGACTPSKGNSHRVEASGWVEARSLIDSRAAASMRILHVQCFVLMQRRDSPQATPLRLAFVKHSPHWAQDDLGGGVCYKAPSTGEAQIALIQISSMHAPCILVRASETAGSTLRLVPIHGKRL
jgi:hypothetical protein